LRLWHRRLGHIGLTGIREMHKKKMVDGLDISDLNAFDFVCEGCALSKSHRLPFPKISSSKYKKMDLIAVDLTGPMSVPTWSGNKYALAVIE
ncbi:hypothetical protein M422DRAFT_133517, partial [Sphaerobolus stellatus SS14]